MKEKSRRHARFYKLLYPAGNKIEVCTMLCRDGKYKKASVNVINKRERFSNSFRVWKDGSSKAHFKVY